MNLLCDYFSFVVFNYCALKEEPGNTESYQQPFDSRFTTEFQWIYVNFTWPSYSAYQYAIENKHYVPENTALAGIKIYNDTLYIAMSRIREGTPITLASMSLKSSPKKNPLLTPFPSWEMNSKGDCSALQSVHSIEVDDKGVVWILDGMRLGKNTLCPAKLVLWNITNDEMIVSYEFPDHVALREGGFLNDIVVDDTDGGMAYITDHSKIDPGLVVYSVAKNKSWKLRDRTMFGEPEASGFVVGGSVMNKLSPIDGIALSPQRYGDRTVYFCALVGFNLYSITTKILRDEELCKAGEWRRSVQFVGVKQSQTDGMMMDNTGNLYYTLLPLYGVGKWHINSHFSTSNIIDQDRENIVWPDGFGFGDDGYLYLLANNINKFFDPTHRLELSEKPLFSVLKLFTGTKSYIYS